MKIRQRTGDKPDSARDRIIGAAAELFHNNGYNATGIDQILKTARATKGSFHHHFGSKKAIALAVIKEIVAPKFNRRMIDPVVHAPKPVDAIRQVIRNLRTQGSTDDLLTVAESTTFPASWPCKIDKSGLLSALFDRWQDEWAKLSLVHNLISKCRQGSKVRDNWPCVSWQRLKVRKRWPKLNNHANRLTPDQAFGNRTEESQD